MQYSIYINQLRASEWGVKLPQATLFSYIYELQSWADSIIINNEVYYWFSKAKASQDLPLISEKPDTIKRYLATLEASGLIKRFVGKGNKIYVRVTSKGKTWNRDEILEVGKKIPSEVGKKIPSEGGKKSLAGREKNPPYYPTNNQLNNNTFVHTDAAPRTYHSFEPINEPLNKQKKETGQNEKQSQKASFLRAKPQEVKFNEFYSRYPLKKSKGSAQKAFAKINPDDSLLKSMIDAIEAQKVDRLARLAAGLFVPDWKQPATWLNSMCWEDEIQPMAVDDTPYQAITDLYNQILGEDFVESVGVETDDRKETISKLWRSMKCDLEKIKSYFVYFGDNAGGWYRGQNDRGWVANFDYICREDTITKARENTL